MHFIFQIEVNNDMEFQYYEKKKEKKKTIGLCNHMCFATKRVK
jgi:hypothetical protein